MPIGPADLLGRELRHPVEAVAGERRVHHQLVDAADPLDEGRKTALGYRIGRYRSSSHSLTCTL